MTPFTFHSKVSVTALLSASAFVAVAVTVSFVNGVVVPQDTVAVGGVLPIVTGRRR